MRRRAFWTLLALAVAAPASAQRPHARPRLDSLLVRARRDPFDAGPQFDLGMAFWDRHRYAQADSAFRRALDHAPLLAAARLALAYLPGSTAPEAHLLRRDAYLLDPFVDPRILRNVSLEDLVPRRQIGEVEEGSMLAPGPLWWEGRAKGAVRSLIGGDAEGAYHALQSVLEAPEMRRGAVLPDLVIWYFGLAAAHAARYDDAAAAFQELAQRAHRRQVNEVDQVIPSTRADLLYLYAVMSLRAGRPQVAISAFEEAVVQDFGLFEACSRLAEIHEGQGDMDEAIADRRRAVTARPELAGLHLELGMTLARAGRTASAESALANAAHLSPDDAEVQWSLATVAAGNGDRDVARAALERFVVVAPARYSEQLADARRRLAGTP